MTQEEITYIREYVEGIPPALHLICDKYILKLLDEIDRLQRYIVILEEEIHSKEIL